LEECVSVSPREFVFALSGVDFDTIEDVEVVEIELFDQFLSELHTPDRISDLI
jgi:hypothetical protein